MSPLQKCRAAIKVYAGYRGHLDVYLLHHGRQVLYATNQPAGDAVLLGYGLIAKNVPCIVLPANH